MISIIVALSENQVIGNNNSLPWHLQEDLKRFKKITTGHIVVMGRKTYKSLGKPLPDRVNIVFSKDPTFNPEGVIVVRDIRYIAQLARLKEEVFVIGGSEIFKYALPVVDKFYITAVLAQIEGDTEFPVNIPKFTVENKFGIIKNTFYSKDEKNDYDTRFIILERGK